ncbi:MAG: TatD family hydrolase [Chloroflexota bacterium]|nr:TatD family hydrolase [Chloroflexota bacterium]
MQTPTVRLIDSHAHLTFEDYDIDRDAVLERARLAGLVAIVTIGIEPSDWQNTLSVAEQYSDVYPALGIHPNSAGETNSGTLGQLATLCKSTVKKPVAIGETGLDYYRDHVPAKIQRESFIAHLDLARQLDLPVIIHNRDAHVDLLRILREEGKGTRGIMHSFSGDMNFANECIRLDYLISLSGPVTFRKAADKHEIARSVPLDKMLVETDCPFLTPEPYRGRRNEPSYVAYTAQAIANLRGTTLDEVANATTQNALSLFGIKTGLDKTNRSATDPATE